MTATNSNRIQPMNVAPLDIGDQNTFDPTSQGTTMCRLHAGPGNSIRAERNFGNELIDASGTASDRSKEWAAGGRHDATAMR